MCISLELGSYQYVPVIHGIEKHTCTKHSQYQVQGYSVLTLVQSYGLLNLLGYIGLLTICYLFKIKKCNHVDCIDTMWTE